MHRGQHQAVHTERRFGFGNVLGTCGCVSVLSASLPADATISTPRWLRALTELCTCLAALFSECTACAQQALLHRVERL